MTSQAATARHFPAATSFDIAKLDELTHPVLRQGIAHWNAVRGFRAFPAREDLKPRQIATLLTHMTLLRAIDGGMDCEFRIVGDEVGRAYRAPLINRRASEVARDLPKAALSWGNILRRVATSRLPLAVHIHTGRDAPEVNFTEAQVVCLPLGPRDDLVDHIVTFAIHIMLGE